MALKFYLNNTEIGEPVGFDNLNVKISRNDYDGMSVEFSTETLEFYGNAVSIIDTAYTAGIDTEVLFKALNEDNSVFYQGKLDLSTYSEHTGEYHTISCKVGEIGAVTMFNNRSDVQVNLNKRKTIGGQSIVHTYNPRSFMLPSTRLAYQCKIQGSRSASYSLNGNTAFMSMMFVNDNSNSYQIKEQGNSGGTPAELFRNLTYAEKDAPLSSLDFQKTYELDTEWYQENILDPESLASKPLGISADMELAVTIETSTGGYMMEFGIYNPAYSIYGSQVLRATPVEIETGYHTYTIKFKRYKRDATTLAGLLLGVKIYPSDETRQDSITGTMSFVFNGSFSVIAYSDDTRSYGTSALLMHEALNIISEAISEKALTVKSDFYGRFDSAVNPISQSAGTFGFGGGSLLAIVNGYNMRGQSLSYSFAVSFKDIMQALRAIHCAGWGVSVEDGVTYIRVEPWEWFYKDDVLLSLTNVPDVKRSMSESNVITALSIGYKKYTSESDYSLIDSPHATRKFTSPTSAITKEVTQECEFIADNYAIEETRRNALKYTSEEFKYDDNIFLFCLTARRTNGGSTSYLCLPDLDTEMNPTLLNPEQQINSVISPARMALNWIKRIFCVNGLEPLSLTTGKLNYQAAFSVKHTTGNTTTHDVYLQDSAANIDNQYVAEDMPLQMSYGSYSLQRKFSAEEIEFSYPLTRSQYATIKANPYGLVSVNGVHGWIKELQYNVISGEASFKLIPKYVNN